MAKHIKINRTYDGIEREESTAGLMFLRAFIMLFIGLTVIGAAALFVYSFQKETRQLDEGAVSNDVSSFYTRFDEADEARLLEYCSSTSTLSEYYDVDTAVIGNGIEVSTLMKDSLEKMLEAARADGISIDIERGYLTYSECNALYKTYLLDFESSGATLAEAEVSARAIFPPGGCNEYQTGMLIKISADNEEDFSVSDTYKWLYRNGINYGFINRYTWDKYEITGINEDLTVYRFVGSDNAKKMRSFGMCLEEYAEYQALR